MRRTTSKMKDAQVYVDGGFADKVQKAKKFALRPGTHDIELRDSDGRPIFKERVAVLVRSETSALRIWQDIIQREGLWFCPSEH